MQKVLFEDLGLIDYKEAWDYQSRVHKDLIATKLANRDKIDKEEIIHRLIFCEHPPVITLGKSGSLDHLLSDDIELGKNGVDFYKINRGGDITFHGPGQLVVYPIFDLDGFFTDVHRYVRLLEQIIIESIANFGLDGTRVKGLTGVWLRGDAILPQRKLCAIGVHLSRWVSMHGLALNINTNLSYFKHIIPCGINAENTAVSSLQAELDKEISMGEVKAIIKNNFAKYFEFEYLKSEL